MKLELKHLAPYLPYGLKGILEYDRNEDFCGEDWYSGGIFDKGSQWKFCGYADSDLHIPLGEGEFDAFMWRNDSTYVCFHHGIKPILRPISDLIKETEIDGNKFIPAEVLFSVDNEEIQNFKDFGELPDYWKESIKLKPRWYSYYQVELLLQWHFDVFGLIENGLAIDINTLKE